MESPEPPVDKHSLVKEVSLVDTEAQAGVQAIQAISTNWTKLGLIVAYISLLTVANVTSLESQTTTLLIPFATSSFLAHSLLSTVAVVQGVTYAVIKPILSKVSDVFGRFESFAFAIFVYTVGYIQYAASNNVKTYAAAGIFYAAGSQGLQMLQQVFVADTTDLRNRAIFSVVFELPFLWTVWAGPPLAQKILDTASWRWGYGIWAIILPVVFVPLAIVLLRNKHKAKKRGQLSPNPLKGLSPWQAALKLWFDLDIFGLILLAAAISLILLPLTLAGSANGGWKNGSIIAMLVVGVVCLLVFPLWERSEILAPHAFFPRSLFSNPTVIAGCLIAFFYFCKSCISSILSACKPSL
jgi:MFS family permease